MNQGTAILPLGHGKKDNVEWFIFIYCVRIRSHDFVYKKFSRASKRFSDLYIPIADNTH